MNRKEKRHISTILIITTVNSIAALLLAVLARRAEGFAQWYSENIYDVLVSTLGRFWGMFPFSAVEILLYGLVAVIVISAGRLLFHKIRGWKVQKEAIIIGARILCTASILLFLYMACCGVNYYRTSFAESTGIYTDSYTSAQMAQVCSNLTEELNSLAEKVERDGNGVMVYGTGMKEESVHAMKQLADEYGELAGYYPKPKMLLVPQILSVQKVTGIYSPFTIEANCNGDITDYNVPFTACHELSHLRGFMREEEANFIAWLACRESDRADFQYSGSLRGWISCMNVLYRSDPESWAKIRVQLNPLAEADLAANREYWANFEGPVADAAQTMNNNYLKLNGQSDGIQSYGRMADLIAAYYILHTA